MPMTTLTNHQVRLAARPVGLPADHDWQFTSEPVPEASDGGVVVKVLVLSLDPAMRGWMNEGKSYIRPVEIGEVMRAGGVGRVVASRNPKFAVGDPVAGTFGVQEYWSMSGEQLPKSGLHKIDLRLGSMTQWLNVLGMPGMTAYFGLLDVGQPQPATPWWCRARPARWGRRWGSWPGSKAAAWSASPAARPSANGSSTNSASTPASTTRPRHPPARSAGTRCVKA